MRLIEIESLIRDSLQHSVEIRYPRYSKNTHRKSMVKLSFIKNENEMIELVLLDPFELNVFDNSLAGEYISHIKAFENQDEIEISFDPYDERVDKIEENDNYIFKAKRYEITSKKL